MIKWESFFGAVFGCMLGAFLVFSATKSGLEKSLSKLMAEHRQGNGCTCLQIQERLDKLEAKN